MNKEDSRSPIFSWDYMDKGVKKRCKRIESKEPLGLWFWSGCHVMKNSASETGWGGGGGLKTVWKVEVARLGCRSLTGGKRDAALRKKKSLLLPIL